MLLEGRDKYTDVALDVDERIVDLLSKRTLTSDAISAILDVPKHEVKRRLRKLELYQAVMVSTVKECYFWSVKRRDHHDR